jgi:hypothetical protein
MTWVTERADNATTVPIEPTEKELLDALIESVYGFNYPGNLTHDETQKRRRRLLAAAFDLMVAAEYYRTVSHLGWVYCCHSPDSDPMAYYPYTSVCPRCVLDGKFNFHQANKPPSGSIGTITSKLLTVYLKALFERHGREIEVLKGSEPIDSVFIDRTTACHTYLFAEVKSAPLLTLPLAIATDRLTTEKDGKIVLLQGHQAISTTSLYKTDTSIIVPIESSETASGWAYRIYPLGNKKDAKDSTWAHRGFMGLLKNEPSFFQDYSKFWMESFDAYGSIDKTSPIFWFTNACGQPSPRPDDWPRRTRGTGYESVSDGKTSVGMDRTDDIKKSIYQVLKLGAEGKPSGDVRYLVAVVSNIHAIRHFDEYLRALKDIIWTRDETGEATKASQLPPETDLYNLFDGIISLTEVAARDPWIETTFNF